MIESNASISTKAVRWPYSARSRVAVVHSRVMPPSGARDWNPIWGQDLALRTVRSPRTGQSAERKLAGQEQRGVLASWCTRASDTIENLYRFKTHRMASDLGS